MSNETPLMKQYKEIKEENRDSILFFRLGDFYEMFFDDAVIASKELGITLTSRNKEKGQDVPLAGIPYHSSASYIAKLVRKGYKVAVCEQVEDPKTAKGIVKREVVKIITPGTVIDTDYLDDKSNNYLLCVYIKGDRAGIAYVDITTGEFRSTEIEGEDIISKALNEIHKISPKEIIVEEKTYEDFSSKFKNYAEISEMTMQSVPFVKNSELVLKDYFKVISLESYGLKGKREAVAAGAMVLEYVLELQKYNELPINKISYDNSEDHMELNLTTQRNLELIQNQREKSNLGTLLWVLDTCKTSMGTRMLKNFIKNPLLKVETIEKRQEDIGYFIDEVLIREEIREILKNIYDIERLIGKVIMGTENGRDLIALKKSIRGSLEIIKILGNRQLFETDLEKLVGIYNLIERSINEEAPFSVREGGMIKSGYNLELDELHDLSKSGKNYILEIETKERERTGIKNLKVKYNKVFGYFIEVTRANSSLVPEDYIRKQTLTNAERYITPELKDYESKVLNAKEKIEALEYQLFKEISSGVKEENRDFQELAQNLAYLDVVTSLSDVAIKNNYVKPKVFEGFSLNIKGGRHPIVEKLVGAGEFIKNDILLDEKKSIIILTGPNMAGKSTYMKQLALIILMAQTGSYVPADYAEVGIVDKIFTRVGASDDLVSGQSTFMVEMSEVANIVNSATEKSFVILDEVGRGTSTFDGISIASSITEYIHDKIGSKTIFATHYHELTELEGKLKRAANYRIEVKETESDVVFLREIVKGGADKSYGIEVARLAGLPKEILNKAKATLKSLETKRALIEKKMKGEQLSLFGGVIESKENSVEEEKRVLTPEEEKAIGIICDTDLNALTPLDALVKLSELKKMLK
ncbi:DNA mismatch repair protein MutS [uncultured Ilyobacter sp.]|uniref:DNA mismatch repair protein MutS n=1 Tax=uncultured Ilyobacter sp. TaxID=544433 RepID=UPI0029C6C7F1|nr:DNA mismatch repair protein MutS [uncultured Ilyobacter sp.]